MFRRRVSGSVLGIVEETPDIPGALVEFDHRHYRLGSGLVRVLGFWWDFE